MNEEYLKRIIKLKLELAEAILKSLPAPVKEQLQESERRVFQLIHDLSEEYLARRQEHIDKDKGHGKSTIDKSSVKPIVVED